MAVFSTNQVRQLYVANELKTPNVIETDNAGSIAVKSDTAKTHLYFMYKGAAGMTRSDLIDIENIIYANAVDADDLAHKLSRYKLTLSADINDGDPIGGQDYILRIQFINYIGISPEYQYQKYGTAHAVSGMTASELYKKLALSLVSNFSSQEEKLLKFYLETGGTSPDTAGTLTEIKKSTKESSLTGTYTGIVVEEAPQEWILGVFPQVGVDFKLYPLSIVVNGDKRPWGVAKELPSVNSIKNGHNIADLEYFCMGERGDVYRGVGFPNVIRTNYLVDPNTEYNVINIHYAYVGPNEDVQKSEKDLTLVVPKVGDDNATGNKLTNDIISAINTATGLSINSLETT